MDEELEKFIAGREIYPGRNCSQGWGIPLLMKIVIKIIKLDYPKDFMKTDSDIDIRNNLKNVKYVGIGTNKDVPIYTHKEIDNLNNDDLRRATYWSIRQTGGYIKTFCKELENWFRNTKWEGLDMLIPDKQAGTAGGHQKIISKPTTNNSSTTRIETIIPIQNEKLFKTYFKSIQKLTNQCYGIKKYIPDIDDKKWIIIFSRKKIAGYLSIDNNNIIHNICVSTIYNKNDTAKQFIQSAVNYICPNTPRLLVDNKGKDYKYLVKLYQTYGFNIIKKDENITYMEFVC
jgi:hypothetical protein